MRNLIRVVVLNRVTGFLLFVGKTVIVVGNGAIAFYYFSGKWVVDGIPQVNLHYYFVPIIVVVIGTYLIADLFFDVYVGFCKNNKKLTRNCFVNSILGLKH